MMKLKHFNIFLVFLAVVLIINLFYPITNFFDTIDSDKLGCNINGNEINDLNLCCSEMAKFSICNNGICEHEGYNVLSSENMLKYCEKRGYNVRY